MTASPKPIPDEHDQHRAGRLLRWYADGYEQAQRIRIASGERIRAILQGRDDTWTPEDQRFIFEPTKDKALVQFQKALVEAELDRIMVGEVEGPVPVVGRAFRRMYEQEREMFAEMKGALPLHPTWHWLKRIKGVGPTLACKILARLDITIAKHPSSFWKHAGLDTVEGEEYRCERCGVVRAFPVGYQVTGTHSPMGTGRGTCKGKLARSRGPEDGVRVRQPRNVRGQKRTYDAYLKKTLWNLGSSFLKASGCRYDVVYRAAREQYERDRPGWAAGRIHLTALRRTEKLFLAHLWEVWRDALGMEAGRAYVLGIMGHTGYIDPWSMAEKGPIE